MSLPALTTRAVALAVWLSVPAVALHAQAPGFAEGWRWARFTTASGLPSNTVTAIAETPGGTPWVATEAGFAWYDGYLWNPVGPTSRRVTGSRPPQVMAGADGGVLGVMDGRLFQGDSSGLEDITPTLGNSPAFVLDAARSPEGILTLVRMPDSAQRIGLLAAGRFTTLAPPASPSLTEAALWGGQPGPIILSAPSGFYLWSGDRWASWFEGGTVWPLTSIARASDGRILGYSSFGPGAGLWEAVGGTRPRRIPGEGAQQAVAVATHVDGEAVVAYEAGDVRHRTRGRWTSLDPVPAGLREVTFLRFRANGDLWSGTRNGLYLYRRSSRRWSGAGRPFPDPRNRVNAIARTRDGTVWLGTGNGLVIRRTDGTERSIATAAGVTLGAVTALGVDSLDHVWVGSGASFLGVVRFDGRQWRRFGEADGLPSFVHKIERDRQGRLWFLGLGGPGGPATRGAYVPRGDGFARWDQEGRLAGHRVYGFADGPEGALWFATSRGLLRWRSGAWVVFERPAWMAVSRRVFTVAADDSGRAWFSGQYLGVGLVDERDSVRHLTSTDGLVDDRVWEIRRGPDGRMWFTTAAGLGSYRDGLWAAFGSEEGLEAPHLWPVVPERERVLVGTLGKGLRILNLGEEDTPPAIRIEPPLVFGRSVQLRWQPLPYWGAARPDRIRTRFRIDQGPWSPWSAANAADVALPGGRRHLEVQALSIFGRLGPTAGLSFVVPRPLPLRPSFFIPALLVLTAAGAFGARTAAQRRAERRQMAALEDQLRQSQKMEAVGQLAGGVAHDFNNILTAIMGHAELLAASLPPGEAAARHDVEEIRVTAERGAAMIRKLLMFGRRGRLEVGPVRLAAVAGDLTAMLARLMPEQIRLVVSQQGDVTAIADRAALEQILVNLATNARDAMPGGGELRIAASVRRLDGVEAARCGLASGGSYACLEVTDSGIGMDEAMLSRIFEPFYTTKAPGKGTGLGMAMVYSLVRQQQGGVEIRSAPQAGTRVRLYFPLADSEQPAETPQAASEPVSAPAVRRGVTILVVEDDATVRAATSRLLARKGYTVVAAEDGQAALEILRNDAARFDLVVTDVMMPRMSGFALHRAAGEARLSVPFIFTSGYSEHPEAGAPPENAVFLPKPWTAAALMAQVDQILEASRSPG